MQRGGVPHLAHLRPERAEEPPRRLSGAAGPEQRERGLQGRDGQDLWCSEGCRQRRVRAVPRGQRRGAGARGLQTLGHGRRAVVRAGQARQRQPRPRRSRRPPRLFRPLPTTPQLHPPSPSLAPDRRSTTSGGLQAVFEGGMGYRLDNTSGVAKGDQPETIYMVVSGTHYNDRCCFVRSL